MISFSLAPTSGRILAYAPDRLVYDAYSLSDDVIVLHDGCALDLDGVYELHLFDAEQEFRAQRGSDDWTVEVIRAEDEIDDTDHFVFSESQFVKERYWIDERDEKIVVNNHFSFNDDGFLRLEGYRLAMES